MSQYTLTPKPGRERYTIQVGWTPHRTFYATVLDFAWDPATEPEEPDTVRLGIGETILDPTDVLIAVEPYAELPDDLLAKLHADKTAHPPRA
jgi:hypothetical protein